MTLENPPSLNSPIPMSKPQTMRLSKGEITRNFTKQHLKFLKSFLAGKNDFPNQLLPLRSATNPAVSPPPASATLARSVSMRASSLARRASSFSAAFQTTEKERGHLHGFLQNTMVLGRSQYSKCFHTHPREMEEINKTSVTKSIHSDDFGAGSSRLRSALRVSSFYN